MQDSKQEKEAKTALTDEVGLSDLMIVAEQRATLASVTRLLVPMPAATGVNTMDSW